MRSDAARGDEPHLRVGRGERLERLDAADRLGGEELHDFQAVVQRHFDVGRRGRSGRDRDVVLHAVADDLRAEAGRDDELRPRVNRLLDTVDGEHRAGAHQHFSLELPSPDRRLGGGGAEGDLGNRQAAGGQGVGQGAASSVAVERDDGNQSMGREFCQEFWTWSVPQESLNAFSSRISPRGIR